MGPSSERPSFWRGAASAAGPPGSASVRRGWRGRGFHPKLRPCLSNLCLVSPTGFARCHRRFYQYASADCLVFFSRTRVRFTFPELCFLRTGLAADWAIRYALRQKTSFICFHISILPSRSLNCFCGSWGFKLPRFDPSRLKHPGIDPSRFNHPRIDPSRFEHPWIDPLRSKFLAML